MLREMIVKVLAKLHRTSRRGMALCLPAALLLVGACAPPVMLPTPTPVPVVALPSDSILPSLSPVVNKIMPSVVYIFVETDPNGKLGGASATGSGIIMREDGYILTNRHVVEGFRRVEVTLQNLQVYEATGVWLDEVMDLAVVKIDGRGFPTAQFADTSRMQVGDWVVAIGHALGLSPRQGGPTVTAGVVSNLGRSYSIDQIHNYDIIQTDAAINPGNSGGPLIDLRGEIVGINSAGAAGQNIGYAINVATASHCFDDLVQYGKSHHPYLGLDVDDITPPMANRMGLSQRTGALITTMQGGGPAEAGGLKTRDVVVRFGETDIVSSADLLRQLWRLEVGDTVEVTVRQGTTFSRRTVVLGERPQDARGI
ncbi:MAG: trypsin-like peptidase domain-containing protein [Dehalococcoidia bacterium]|nr:trypsin-like peptidase domain-containing protein [Dehalococcoidia bacterium]